MCKEAALTQVLTKRIQRFLTVVIKLAIDFDVHGVANALWQLLSLDN